MAKDYSVRKANNGFIVRSTDQEDYSYEGEDFVFTDWSGVISWLQSNEPKDTPKTDSSPVTQL